MEFYVLQHGYIAKILGKTYKEIIFFQIKAAATEIHFCVGAVGIPMSRQ
jgi:hypothetical protein